MKILLFLPLLALLLSSIPPPVNKIKWLNFTELKAAYTKKPKPILIDVYTSWCGWCKVMDKETYDNEKVATYINTNYYAVKFDAETTDSVSFGSKNYGYNPAYRANDLAVSFLNGNMGFPTTVLLSSLNAKPAPLSGFMKPNELEPPLKYFGEGIYKTKDFNQFMSGFTATW